MKVQNIVAAVESIKTKTAVNIPRPKAIPSPRVPFASNLILPNASRALNPSIIEEIKKAQKSHALEPK